MISFLHNTDSYTLMCEILHFVIFKPQKISKYIFEASINDIFLPLIADLVYFSHRLHHLQLSFYEAIIDVNAALQAKGKIVKNLLQFFSILGMKVSMLNSDIMILLLGLQQYVL